MRVLYFVVSSLYHILETIGAGSWILWITLSPIQCCYCKIFQRSNKFTRVTDNEILHFWNFSKVENQPKLIVNVFEDIREIVNRYTKRLWLFSLLSNK